jgi:hypothetical protein
MYQLFHNGEAAPSIRNLKLPKGGEEWGSKGNEANYVSKLRRLLAKMEPEDQKLLLHLAQKVARIASPEPFHLSIPSRLIEKFQL